MRTLGLGGLSVTMPHKEDVAAAVDVLDPAAAALRSVNTVVALRDGRLAGHSTDGDGFVASMSAAGWPVGRSPGVRARRRGSGPLDRRSPGAQRRRDRGRGQPVRRRPPTAARAGRRGRPSGRLRPTCAPPTSWSTPRRSAWAPATCRCDPALLHDGQVVADIVYHPRRTALLDAADAAGAAVVDGLGMLVHQAALQQALWTGRTPDVAAMAAAADRELAIREAR